MTPVNYHIFPQAFSPIECAELVGYACSTYPIQAAVVGYGGESRKDSMRRSDIRWMNVADPKLAELCGRLRKCFLVAASQTLGTDYRDFSDLQFTQYASWNQGHYDWHTDDHAKEGGPPWDRKLSLVLQLSNPGSYAGGRLELDPALPADVFTKQGDLIVFKASTRHRVSPVTSGVRWSLVTWALGPRDALPTAPPKKVRRSK